MSSCSTEKYEYHLITINNNKYFVDEIKGLLNKNFDEANFAIAFAKRSGVDLLKEDFINFSGKIDFYIGIGMFGTSYEALCQLFEIVKCKDNSNLYIVLPENGIFHPKVYSFMSQSSFTCLVGSNNFTKGGLETNCEASIAISDNYSNKNFDKKKLKIENYFKSIRNVKQCVCVKSKSILDHFLLVKKIKKESDIAAKVRKTPVFNRNKVDSSLKDFRNKSKNNWLWIRQKIHSGSASVMDLCRTCYSFPVSCYFNNFGFRNYFFDEGTNFEVKPEKGQVLKTITLKYKGESFVSDITQIANSGNVQISSIPHKSKESAYFIFCFKKIGNDEYELEIVDESFLDRFIAKSEVIFSTEKTPINYFGIVESKNFKNFITKA